MNRRNYLRLAVILFTALLLFVSSVSQAIAAPVVVNFDDRPGLKTPNLEGRFVPPQFMISDQYLPLGVLFNSSGGGVFLSAGDNPVSPPNVVAGTHPGPSVGYTQPVTATFFIAGMQGVVDFVRLTVTGSSDPAILFSAFDVNGQLLGSVSQFPMQLSFPSRIHSVVLSGGPVAFDNFTFDGLMPIPEPTPVILAIIGFGLLLVFQRRLLALK
jgi:hypothetical protein